MYISQIWHIVNKTILSVIHQIPVLKFISKHLKVVFIYFIESINVLIIHETEVLAENLFLVKSLIIPVLPPGMNKVPCPHLLCKQSLLYLYCLKVQDVVVRKGADRAVKRGRFPMFIIGGGGGVQDILNKLPPAGVCRATPSSINRQGGSKIIPKFLF